MMLALVIFSTLLAIGTNALLIFPAIAISIGFARSGRCWLPRAQRASPRPVPAGPAYAPLQARLAHLSIDIFGLPRAPHLAIADRSGDWPARPQGTRRRWYVVFDEPRAQKALSILDTPEQAQIDAVLLHELHHLKHSDLVWLEYARVLPAMVTNCCSGLSCCLLALRYSSL